jgi:hypothetical protein
MQFNGTALRSALEQSSASTRVSLVHVATAPVATVPPLWRAIAEAMPWAVPALSDAEKTELLRIARIDQMHVPFQEALIKEGSVAFIKRRDKDVQRHGLRHLTPPTCDAVEPHAKAFKRCGRCRAHAYCCPEHAAADWKRHKREDGCKAPDADIAPR